MAPLRFPLELRRQKEPGSRESESNWRAQSWLRADLSQTGNPELAFCLSACQEGVRGRRVQNEAGVGAAGLSPGKNRKSIKIGKHLQLVFLTGALALWHLQLGLEKYPGLAQARPSEGRGPLTSQVNPHWAEPASPKLVFFSGETKETYAPPKGHPLPRHCGHPQGPGPTKCRRKREIAASPIAGSLSVPGEGSARPPGPVHCPNALPRPLSGPTDARPGPPEPGSPGHPPGIRRARRRESAAAAGGRLGPFGESQAFSWS